MILRSLLVVLLFMLINLSRSRKLLQFETENSKKKEDFIRDILQRQKYYFYLIIVLQISMLKQLLILMNAYILLIKPKN